MNSNNKIIDDEPPVFLTPTPSPLQEEGGLLSTNCLIVIIAVYLRSH